MTAFVLRVTTRYLLPLLLMFSFFLFIRGHNEPGGGFAAGLIAAAGFALYVITFGAKQARTVLGVEPRILIGAGLAISLSSGLVGILTGKSYLAAIWTYIPVPGLGKIEFGTPVLFDLGVYLAVMGVTLAIVFELEEKS